MAMAKSYLSRLNDRLSHSLFLSSNDKPTASDFSAYTMIWYHDMVTNLTYVKEFKHIINVVSENAVFTMRILNTFRLNYLLK